MEAIRQDTRQAVERLEGQVARLRSAVWVLFLALLAAAGAFIWQRRHPRVEPSIVKVKGLIIEDGNGPDRVLITGRGISITDEQGMPRVGLSVNDKGNTQFLLKDAQGASVLEAEPGALTLTDAKKDAAVLSTTAGPTLQLRRADKIVVKQPWDAQDLK